MEQRRRYRQALPWTVWEAIEAAKDGGCSLMSVIRTNKLGVCANQAYTWMQKSHAIYAERRAMCFDGTSHLNIVADPANHSRRSTMVGIAWSWEETAGAVCDIQQMPASSKIYEDELGAAASHLREIRLERISTYRCRIAYLSDKLGDSVHRPGTGYMGRNLCPMSGRRAIEGSCRHCRARHPGGVVPGWHRRQCPCGPRSRIDRPNPRS